MRQPRCDTFALESGVPGNADIGASVQPEIAIDRRRGYQRQSVAE